MQVQLQVPVSTTEIVAETDRTSSIWPGHEGRLPDFLIVGTMKAGTSSLRGLLVQHSQIFMRDEEVPFFSLDDVEEHRSFSLQCDGRRLCDDFHKRLANYREWYLRRFDAARSEQRIGDASTAYMPSRRAARRLAAEVPNVKLIVSMRDPASRAYSHYWHIVRRGWAVHDFDDTLLYEPGSLISRGFYKEQLETYYELFPKEQIHVVVFEEMLRDAEKELSSLWRFLEVDPPRSVKLPHHNKSNGPWSLALQLLGNRLLRGGMTELDPTNILRGDNSNARVNRRVRAMLERFNLRSTKYPAMAAGTRKALEALFTRENAGLSELVGRNVSNRWSISV